MRYSISNRRTSYTRAPYRDTKQPTAKRSGCTHKKEFTTAKSKKFKKIVVNGWKVTKGTGLFSFVATHSPEGDKKIKDPSKYMSMVAKVTHRLGTSTEWAFWNIDKQILTIPSMNLVADPIKNYVAFIMPKSLKNRR